MSTGTIQHVSLSQLHIDDVNIRKTGRGEAEPAFIGSIEKRGVIEPLIARKNADGFKITNGGKRLAALQHMQKKGLKANGIAVTEAFPVAIIVREEDDAAAIETSLITNIVRAPTHPVDQFEAFAELIRFGDTAEAIAKRYGMKTGEVRQALSLARIHPDIRAAWREGKLDGEAAEAYAQTQDLEHQLRTFKKLKGRSDEAWAIKNEIEGDHNSPRVDTLLKFVGAKEYEAAGHQVNPSLFSGNDERDTIRVNNIPALRAMAAKKLEAECDRLKADGWGWAILKDGAPKDLYSWRRLPPGNPTKEQKAAAGCVIGFDYSGKLEIARGYIKPGEKIKIEKTAAQKNSVDKAKKTKDETGGISGGLALRLSQQITRAAHDALQTDTTLALRLAVCAMASGSGFGASEGPAKISLSGMSELGEDDDREFGGYWKLTAGKSVAELLKMLATWTARSLNMTCHHAASLPLTGEHDDDSYASLLNAIPAKTLNVSMRKHFDAADYFKSVSGEIVKTALQEMNAVTPTSPKKADLVAAAVEVQAKTGWLPRELRTKHYDGPQVKAAAKTKGAGKIKKKGR